MKLSGKRVAVLATDGFEEAELTSPKKAMEDAGAMVDIVSPYKSGKSTIKSWDGGNWGEDFQIDKKLSEVSVEDYHALILPGGVINPDKLRRNEEVIAFVKDFFNSKKPVAAICHAPWLLAEANVIDGRKVTSFKSIKTDMLNAGADWRDEEVVVDNGLITSRNPDDLPAFNAKIIEEIIEGKHEARRVSMH